MHFQELVVRVSSSISAVNGPHGAALSVCSERCTHTEPVLTPRGVPQRGTHSLPTHNYIMAQQLFFNYYPSFKAANHEWSTVLQIFVIVAAASSRMNHPKDYDSDNKSDS